MLVVLFPNRDLSDRKLWHVLDLFKPGDKFSDGDGSRIDVRGVIGPPKQGGEVIGCRSVGEEDTVQDRISRLGVDD